MVQAFDIAYDILILASNSLIDPAEPILALASDSRAWNTSKSDFFTLITLFLPPKLSFVVGC